MLIRRSSAYRFASTKPWNHLSSSSVSMDEATQHENIATFIRNIIYIFANNGQRLFLCIKTIPRQRKSPTAHCMAGLDFIIFFRLAIATKYCYVLHILYVYLSCFSSNIDISLFKKQGQFFMYEISFKYFFSYEWQWLHSFSISNWTLAQPSRVAYNISSISALAEWMVPPKNLYVGSFLAFQCNWQVCKVVQYKENISPSCLLTSCVLKKSVALATKS